MERVFRYLASLLYFFDRLDKLLALESSAAGEEEQEEREQKRRVEKGGETQMRITVRIRRESLLAFIIQCEKDTLQT